MKKLLSCLLVLASHNIFAQPINFTFAANQVITAEQGYLEGTNLGPYGLQYGDCTISGNADLTYEVIKLDNSYGVLQFAGSRQYLTQVGQKITSKSSYISYACFPPSSIINIINNSNQPAIMRCSQANIAIACN